MKVELIEYTPQPDLIAGAAAHSCRSSKACSEILETEGKERLKKILRKAVERGHTSVAEHASFTFSIEGISRTCSHQLVRHRIASYSQQSQREIKLNEEEFVTPPEIKSNPRAKKKFHDIMKEVWKTYRKLIEEEGIPQEDSRFVLPNAAKTNIVVTMNGRALMNFFELRTCMHAQWEIRAVANKMLSEVKKIAPKIFKDAGPPCKRRKVCPENDSECELYEKYISKDTNDPYPR